MSHIVKGKVSVKYKDPELLLKALEGLGRIEKNEKLYRVGLGYTTEKYPLVLIDERDKTKRIGFKQVGDSWQPYQENYGSYGRWTTRVAGKIEDRYIAYHYEKNLVSEGFSVQIQEHSDGSLELVAEEAVW